MNVLELPHHVLLFLSRWCDATDCSAMASTCETLRHVFRRGQRLRLVATPRRIRAGMFDWLERCVLGPPMASLTIILQEMMLNVGRHRVPIMDQPTFLSAVRAAVTAAIPDLTFVIGVPLSLSSLADAMQSLACGGRLCLDLSNWSLHHLTALHDGQPLWTILMRQSGLHLKLNGTGANDRVINGMVCAINASLLTGQPVEWQDVTFELATNAVTDEGLTALVRGLGRCPQLVISG